MNDIAMNDKINPMAGIVPLALLELQHTTEQFHNIF